MQLYKHTLTAFLFHFTFQMSKWNVTKAKFSIFDLIQQLNNNT